MRTIKWHFIILGILIPSLGVLFLLHGLTTPLSTPLTSVPQGQPTLGVLHVTPNIAVIDQPTILSFSISAQKIEGVSGRIDLIKLGTNGAAPVWLGSMEHMESDKGSLNSTSRQYSLAWINGAHGIG